MRHDCASVAVGDLLLIIGGIRFIRHHLRTAEAGLFAFLTKPAASGADLAGGKRVDHRRNAFDDPLSQAAGITLEMFAAVIRARRGKWPFPKAASPAPPQSTISITYPTDFFSHIINRESFLISHAFLRVMEWF